MPETRTFTREELYEAVWRTPIVRLAAEFGISDVALAKTCRRMNVPRPPRGYWGRIAAGYTVKRTQLPKPRQNQPTTATFLRAADPSYPRAPAAKPPEVTVSTTLECAHEVVRTIGRALRSAQIDEHERITLGGEKMPVFCVTVATHRRGLLILDALAKAVEARGHRVLVRRPSTDDERWLLQFDVGGEPIDLSLIEPLTALQDARETGEMTDGASTVYAPAGRLQFVLHKAGWREKGWSDTETRFLEQRLGRIVFSAEEIARTRREQKEAAERRRQAELEAERKRREAERRAKHNEALRHHLHTTVERWQTAQQIRAFVRAVENAVADQDGDASLIVWLRWAEQYARSLDPLSRTAAIAMPLDPSQLDDASQLR